MVLTVLMFGGTRLMAQNENNSVDPQTTPTEENLESNNKGEKGASLVEEGKNTDIDSNEAEAKEDAGKTESTEAEANKNTNTEVSEPKANADAPKAKEEEKTEAIADAKAAAKEAEKPADKEAEKPAEKTAVGNGVEDGAKLQAAPAKAPETVGEGTGTGTEPKKPADQTPEVDISVDPELSELQKQIDEAEKAKDDKKAAELKKQYADKLFKNIEEAGADKLNKEVLDRFTDADRTKEFYQIQAEYEELKKKSKEGKLTQEEVDAFNKKVGSFKPPRKLDTDEKSALDKLQETPYVPGIADNSTEDAKKLYKAYEDAKKALEKALDPENPRTTDDKGLQDLVDAFKKAETALTEAIRSGVVNPKYTKGNPEISIFPLDNNGKAGKELNEDTYYIPDATDFKLLFQVNKDKEAEGSTTKFRFTIKNLKNVGEVSVPEASLSNLVFLNKTAVHLQKDEKTGEYYFETTADQNFGIAQLKFNMPGFRAAFHEGFELKLEGTGVEKAVTKKFLITKKGYEDYTDLNGIGSHKKDNPQKDVDAGDTQDAIVDGNTDKVFDFFTMLKKSDAYIDKVLVNSPDGDSLPLSSVDITITAPKNFDGNFADFIHKSGLEYHDLGEGKYQLKLDLKKFNKDENFKVKDGKLFYNGNEITGEGLTNAILESKDGKNYIDGEGTEHKVTTTTVLEGTLGEGENAVTYQVRLSDDKHQVKSLWKKDGDAYVEVGTFDKDGKVTTKEGKTFKLLGNELISYTSEKDVYEGNVSNKTEKDKNGAEKIEADPTVTPTFDGKQVTVETEEKNSDGTKTTKTSYGGTIVKGKFFQKIGENDYKYLIDQTGLTFAYIDDNGKMYTSQNDEGTLKPVYNKVFKKVTKDDKVEYYIVDGLEYKAGLVLIDKFGRQMKDITVTEEGGQYTFTHAKKKGKDAVVTTQTSQDGRTIKVDETEKSIFVNNKNYVEKNDPEIFESIIGKYYYDKEKKVFVEVKDGTDQKVIGDKFYDGLTRGSLVRKLVEIYTKDKKDYVVDEKTQRYYGSANKADYYTHNNRVYVKKGNGEDTYLMSADGGKADVIAAFATQKVIQTLGTGKDAKQVITDEKNIFDAVQNAKFAFRFPGFLAGENVIYNVHADVKAKYMAPNYSYDPDTEGSKEFDEKSIFKDDKGNELKIKTVDKYFTIKIKENKKAKFFKDAPKEFKDIPDYNFFNIFYRDSDYTQRDQLLKPLLEAKATYNNLSEEDKKKADEATKKQLAILDEIQKELAKRFGGAQFVLDNNKTVVIKDKKGKVVELDRTLLWEIGFNNEDGVLFPEDRDTSIVVEDYNMDNRLVYDEIIINDTVEKWNEAKTNAENKGTEFKGTDQYFFLDQIDNIRLGVSRGYVDGEFIAVGKEWKIDKEQIETALKGNGEISLGYEGNKVTVKVTRDTDKGQIRIKVINAFYKKNNDYSENNKDKNNKFYSPTQKAYEKQRQKFINDANSTVEGKGFKVVAGNDAQATLDAFKKSFENFIKETYGEKTDCFGTLTHLFEERLKKLSTKDASGNDKTAEAMKAELEIIRNSMVEELGKMDLKYLDPSKDAYKYDDMRFNAIRLEFIPNRTIADIITGQRTKKFGVTSVIVPDVDIPYTDEFGKALTNKDMYLNKYLDGFVNEVLKDDKFIKDNKINKDTWKENEEAYLTVMRAAYEKFNEVYKEKIKDLVTAKDDEDKYAWNKYTIKKGNELDKDDLAIDGKPLEGQNGRINPWFIDTESKDENGNPKSEIVEIASLVADGDAKNALTEKYGDKAIDLIAYYMLKEGYNRATFKNYAQYKLPKQEQGPGIYGEENNWKEKLCYPGPIGKCIEMSGGDKEPDTPGKIAKSEDGLKAKNEITITYPKSDDKPNEEHPKVDKKHKKSGTENDTSAIDIADGENGKEKDQRVDFTIDVSVNQMKKTDKEIYDALNGKKSEIKPEDYSVDGHYKYQDGTLIMDILPNIFKLSNGEKVELVVHDDKLISGGSFKSQDALNTWKEGIKYQYLDDLKAYIDGLKDEKQKELLQKAYDKAAKDGGKVQAVIAWLPAFDAPTKTTDHFTFKLTNVLVDKKEFKDYIGNGAGVVYTNHAIFKDNGEVYFASTDVTIKKGKEGSVDKFLRIYDENGKIINENDKKEWFKGNAKLKFGDKFDYKLRVHNKIDIQNTSRVGEMLSTINLKDTLPNIDKGLKPVLRDFVEIQKGYENKFDVKYYIGKTPYTKKQIEDAMAKAKEEGKKSDISLDKVTKITISSDTANVENGDYRDFVLPMMVPELDAKIEDGKVIYIGKDGEKHELGKAKDFFDLDKLTKPGKENEMAFDNKVKDSNTVTVYLDKERFIRLFKEFFDVNGNEIKKDRPEMKFDIYQYQTDKEGNPIKDKDGNIIKVKVLDKDGKPLQLVVNEKNKFTDMVDRLPLFKKIITIDKKGNVIENVTNYKYEIKEVDANAYDVEYEILDNGKDQLGFVIKAKNYEKPEIPPEYPKDHPKNVKVKITVNKVWKVLKGGETPSIQVELYANGEATGKIITLGADGSWSASFEDLPSKDANGKEIIYTVREIGESNELTKIDDRTFEVIYTGNLKDGFTIINKEIPPDDEKPKDKKEPKKHKPNDEEGRDRTPKKNRIPKTGVNEDLGAIYFAFVLLLGLVFIKKRYLVK